MFSSEWTRHLKTEKQKQDFEALARGNSILLGRLLDLLDDKMASLDQKEMSKTTYENPAYPYTQAHINGRRAGLNEVRQLLAFLDEA